MRIHYFQRYHEKENVATANTMLLLSRLYSYSSDKFFKFLKKEYFLDEFNPEIIFTLQEKSVESVPDATITQESFKVVVETKLSDWFYKEQLIKHLKTFNNEKYKVIMTLAPVFMDETKKEEFDKNLKEYNLTQTNPIIHINTTFEEVANAIKNVIDDRDVEMQEVLDDYLDYCYSDGLIPVSDSWKYMKMQLANTTFDFNLEKNVYYNKAEKGFRPHDILGLYQKKSIRAIGKIVARITAIENENGIKYNVEYGDLTEDRKMTIEKAMYDSASYGYDLRTIEHRYFFVEKFYETDFRKDTLRAPFGSRIFNLTELLKTDEIPSIENLAEILKSKTWQ